MKKLLNFKGIGYVVALLLIVSAASLYTQYKQYVSMPSTEPNKDNQATFTIRSEKITEENFTGSKPVIAGSGPLVVAAQKYIDEEIAEFKKSADVDVPDMRAHFGSDSPTAHYTIDIEATYISGPKTESIVLGTYAYTGGANGNSTYKVITADKVSGKILSLSNLIQKEKTSAFTAVVKQALLDWRPDESDDQVVFPDEVKALSFNDFSNWSLDDKNLTIYFDKYAIGPGVLGAVEFPLPIEKVQDFINPNFLNAPNAASLLKTFTDTARGITFQYPEKIPATYIYTVDWPPKVEIVDSPFTCTEAGSEIARAGKTEKITVNNHTYCVTKESEGAAGSIYTNYAYAMEKENKTVIFTFSLRFVQCANYDDPQKASCTAERGAFDIDSIMDTIINSTRINNT